MKQYDAQHLQKTFPVVSFQKALLAWYERHKRDLPWRHDQDPYKIWVSEIMLQQTQVDTVIPYFEHFMERFPTLEALAEADEADVLKAWEGLGYYSRARNLQTGVREVCADYQAKVPTNKKDVLSLKGVGPYTAGAILSIAYDQPEPAVDGNVMRVLSRILYIEDDIAKAKTRTTFTALVEQLIPAYDPSSFNQALMELGAMVCTPKAPNCLLCPVQSYCHAFAEGRQEELPNKQKKKPPKVVPMTVAVLWTSDQKVLIRRRPEGGLLAGLWEFPVFPLSAPTAEHEQIEEVFQEHYQLQARLTQEVCRLQHVFTHLKWQMTVYEGYLQDALPLSEDMTCVAWEDLAHYAFPSSQQKIIAKLNERKE